MELTRDSPPEFQTMVSNLLQADAIYYPSKFWDVLNARHTQVLLSPGGYETFKRTVNNSYFQFPLPAFRRALPILLARWLRRPTPAVIAARFETPPFASSTSERLFAIVIALYAEALRHGPYGELLEFNEPSTGGPLFVRYGPHRVTQDLCHSVEEFCALRVGLRREFPLRNVLEIGAGYGRFAWLFLHAERVRYHIVDIPPALYLSQRYLSEVFPGLRIFRFRPFSRYSNVADEILASDLIFLEPQQLEHLPDEYFDLTVTISTLHEMRPEQIRNFLHLVDRKCRGAFYMKQWSSWWNHVDGVTITARDYPIPSSWRRVFSRPPLVPRRFFEALYLCR